MSYEIIKKITVKNNKVFITGCSNNVSPRTPYEWECPSLTKILVEKGQLALDIAILKDYESGDFQKGSNKYTRALSVLKHFPEYPSFDWRSDASDEKRKSIEFENLLAKALTTRLPKEKFYISKMVYRDHVDQPVYLRKRKGARIAYWVSKGRATVFNFKDDAEHIKSWFTGSESWIITN